MNFSVIVPCYNTGAKIGLALSSLLNQDIPIEDIEVLIIDDHSIDKSHLDLATTYIEKYQMNIKFFENTGAPGPGNSRNIGLEHSTNDWITFLDSDDKFTNNAFNIIKSTYDKAIKQNLNPNIIVGSFISTDLQENPLTKPQNLPTMSHGKFYRKDFLNQYNIKFKKDLRTHEDLYFNSCILALLYRGIINSKEYIYTDAIIYHWRNNPNSFSQQPLETRYKDLIDSLGMPFLEGAKEQNQKCLITMIDLLYQLYFFTQYYLYYQKQNILENYKILEYNKLYKQLIFDELKIKKEFVMETLLQGTIAANKYASLFSYCCNFVGENFQPVQTLKDFIVE